MKKLYSILAAGAIALSTAFSANAFNTPNNLYIVGTVTANGVTPNWDPSKVVEMTKEGNTFTLDAVSFNGSPAYFHFLDTKGSNWPSNRYSAGAGNSQAVTEGVAKTVVLSTSDNSFSFSGEANQAYKVVVDCAAGTLMITKTDATVEVSYPKSLYVIGQVNGKEWDPSEGIELTSTDDGKNWTGSGKITGSGQFSFAELIGENWDVGPNAGTRYAPAGDITVTSGTQFDLYIGGASSSCWTVTPGEYDFAVDIENMKATVTLKAVTYPQSLFVIGNVEGTGEGDWDVTKGIALTSTDGGKTWNGTGILNQATSYFAFAEFLSTTSNWAETNEGLRYQPGSDAEVTAGVQQSLVVGTSGAWYIASGNYEFSVNIDDMTFTLTEAPTPRPSEIYMMGSTGGDWIITESLCGIEFVDEGDGFFTAENAVLTGKETYFFRFATSLSSSNDDWTQLGIQYGSADGNDTSVSFEDEMEMEMEIGTNNWVLASGTYSFYLSFDDMTLTVEQVPTEPVITITEDKQPNAEGKYEEAFNVTIATDDDDDTIYYSLDGSEPENLYTAPVEVAQDATLKVKAVRADGGEATTEQTYTFSTTGIFDVVEDAANGVVEYYNLQGVRIANPAPGQVVIVRQGNEVNKVLVK